MVNSEENTRQEAPKSARPPEYTIIHRQASSRGDIRQQPQQSKKTWQRKKEVQLEERLSRRAQVREQQYESKRRRQWMLAIALVLVLIALIALARCNT